jgi:hypothetical protein
MEATAVATTVTVEMEATAVMAEATTATVEMAVTEACRFITNNH